MGNNQSGKQEETEPIISNKAKAWRLLVGFCNALAHYLTLCAIQMISPALTHIIRGTEPIWMMTFSYVMRVYFYHIIHHDINTGSGS